MSQVSLDSGEMKDFLKHIIDNNRFIQEKGMKPVATEVVGDSGLGKTTVVIDIAKEHGLNYVKPNLAQIEELGDLVGFPVRQFQLCKEGTALKKASPAMKTVIEKLGEFSQAMDSKFTEVDSTIEEIKTDVAEFGKLPAGDRIKYNKTEFDNKDMTKLDSRVQAIIGLKNKINKK